MRRYQINSKNNRHDRHDNPFETSAMAELGQVPAARPTTGSPKAGEWAVAADARIRGKGPWACGDSSSSRSPSCCTSPIRERPGRRRHQPAVTLVQARNHWKGDASGLRFAPSQLVRPGARPAGWIDSAGLLVLTQDMRLAARSSLAKTRHRKLNTCARELRHPQAWRRAHDAEGLPAAQAGAAAPRFSPDGQP